MSSKGKIQNIIHPSEIEFEILRVCRGGQVLSNSRISPNCHRPIKRYECLSVPKILVMINTCQAKVKFKKSFTLPSKNLKLSASVDGTKCYQTREFRRVVIGQSKDTNVLVFQKFS